MGTGCSAADYSDSSGRYLSKLHRTM
jgi:hypothetical protein